MTEFAIRPIRLEDNAAVAAIIRTVMTEFGAVGKGFSIADPEVDGMYEAYQGPQARFYVVERNGSILGCGGFAPLTGGEPDTCELRKMYYLPEARGKGIGRRLAEQLLAEAREVGFRKMYLETLVRMEDANRLYRKLGFQPLAKNLGSTGHCGCDFFYVREL